MKYLRKTSALLAVFLFLAMLAHLSPVFAAPKNNSPAGTSTGNDISWPQCGKSLPSNQAFGIVGVTGGYTNNTNPCLAQQLAWSQKSSGKTSQSKTQLYVNTANPGGLGTGTWPTSNTGPDGFASPNPYVTCDGSLSTACAWQYGWNRALEDVLYRFPTAAQAAGISSTPYLYNWWLDVETSASWESGSPAALERNKAVLQGMSDYFNTVSVKVGLYSTAYQWNKIVGTTNPGNSLTGANSWLAGARSQKSAASNCSLPALTSGGKVTLTQYISGSLDYDYSCN